MGFGKPTRSAPVAKLRALAKAGVKIILDPRAPSRHDTVGGEMNGRHDL